MRFRGDINMEIINFILDNGMEILGYVTSIFVLLLAISLRIPGEQPDKALQSVVDFLSKFSKK